MYLRMRKSRVLIFPLLTITGIVLVATLLWDLSGYSLCHRESSRCACHKCLTDNDPWFNEIIGEAPKPFLSRKHKLSEDDFNWWKRLQGAKHQNLTLYNQTVEKLFQILTPITDVADPSPDHCRSCAVVGNSGNLKGSRYGALIDFHDIVIRINYGRTNGYETDVGTRTTHRVMYPESVTKLDNTTHLVFFPFKTHDFEWLYKCLNPGESGFRHSDKIVNKDLIMILHPAFIKYVHEVWLGNKGYYPSTGFLTVVLSLLMCDEVTIFGFGADSEGNWSHYFDILRNKQLKTGAHPGQYEYRIIERLHKKKKITFFKGCVICKSFLNVCKNNHQMCCTINFCCTINCRNNSKTPTDPRRCQKNRFHQFPTDKEESMMIDDYEPTVVETCSLAVATRGYKGL